MRYGQVAAAPAWTLYEVSFASVESGAPEQVRAVDGIPIGPRHGLPQSVSRRTLLPVFAGDYASTVIHDISEAGRTRVGVRFVGALERIYSMD